MLRASIVAWSFRNGESAPRSTPPSKGTSKSTFCPSLPQGDHASSAAPRQGMATIEMKTTFFRPAQGRLRALGELLDDHVRFEERDGKKVRVAVKSGELING